MISLTIWYANWSESSLLLYAINHVLEALAKANSSDYTGVCRGRRHGEGQRREYGSAMRGLLFVPTIILHGGIFKL